MNWQQFRAFVWLRWRLRVNQLKRGGIANAIVLGLLAVFAGLAAIGLFVIFFLVGMLAMSHDASLIVLFVWDGLVCTLLFFWAVGLLAELQRSEVLSLDKFLHLPVSLWGAFLLNYLSSLFSLNLMVFLPAMIGFNLGLVMSLGPLMLITLPLLAAFVLMVTALTYQFQGWLASLMVNKRRRRTIIVAVTIAFVLVVQVPNAVNMYVHQHRTEADKKLQAEIDFSNPDTKEAMRRLGRIVNTAVPPGWLPLGAMAAAEGDILPAVLGTLGFALIGTGSLWRAYKTTLRLYTGTYTAGKETNVAVAHVPSVRRDLQEAGKSSARLLEKQLPWVSDHASAIAMATFRSLTRAPEAKMMLLTPIILTLIFGSMFVSRRMDPHEFARPLMAFGGMSTALLGMVQLVGNQFGFDRGGFRVFVLCAARRSDILLGKNLAFAPLGLGLATLMAILVEIFYPMRFDHVLALLPQMVSMYIMLCMMGNWLSLLAPMPIASGSLKPRNPKLIPILVQMAFFMVLPMTLAPMVLPLGIEFLLQYFGGIEGIPICLVLSLLECVAVLGLYRLFLGWQGDVLQSRERRILEIVTAKVE